MGSTNGGSQRCLCSPPATTAAEVEAEEEEEQAFLHAMQLTGLIALPMTLKAAAELGALEVIAAAARKGGAGKLTAAEVAERINLKSNDDRSSAAALDRILRLLASYSVLTCSVKNDDEVGRGGAQGRYGASPALKYLTRGGDGGGGSSLAALGCLLFNKVHMESWHYLKYYVLNDEIPFEKAHGTPLFEYILKNPAFSEIFNQASASHAAIVMYNILDKYTGFDRVEVLVDVAGGVGTNVAMIVKKHPNIKGINFDLPHVIASAPSYSGVEHIGGDMFVSVPKGDAILLKWVLHGWADEHCVSILKNCWKALPENGEVIVVEYILPVSPESNLVSQSMFNIDLVLLAASHGGKERTEEEYIILARQAGFIGFELLISYAGVWLFKLTKFHPMGSSNGGSRGSHCSPPATKVGVAEAEEEEQAFLHAMQLTGLIALPMTLKAAAELGALEVIAAAARNGGAEQLTAAEVVERINLTSNDDRNSAAALDRILRLLASYSVLTCSVKNDEVEGRGGARRRYGASPALKYLTRGGDGGRGSSLAALACLFFNTVHMESWHYLKYYVLNDEIPFEKAHGTPLIEYISKDPAFSEIYNQASASHAAIVMYKILDKYTGFDRVEVLVDVAGGVGTNVAMIVKKHPNIKGINFDLPHVIASSPSYSGVDHVGGDMFVGVPKGDAILLKWVLHSWADGHCVIILKNCWKALPENGEVIVVEYILPVSPESNLVSQSMLNIDLVLLATSPGGKERTEEEYRTLASQAGFNGFELLITYAGVWLFKLIK